MTAMNVSRTSAAFDIFQQEAAGICQAAEANSVSMLRERTLAVELQYGVMPVLKDTDG